MKDCIVIGAGPAGLAAALYLARYEKKVLLISHDLGGQAFNAGEIENYPGFSTVKGNELIQKMFDQVKQYDNVEIKLPGKVQSLEKKGESFIVKGESGDFESKSVIIANGKHHRKLGLTNEEAFVGKGLSYCATCDGQFARGKHVVVVGGGNSAVSSALILGEIAESVTVLSLEELKAEQVRIERMEKNPKIKLITFAKTVELREENGFLSGLVYEDKSGNKNDLMCQMVFVEIGYVPNSDLFTDLVETNERKEIVVNPDNSTKTPGLYACGDITDIPYKQVVIASGDGAKAAMAVNQYLEKN